MPEYPPTAKVYLAAVDLVLYALEYIGDGRILYLPYAGGLLDQPGDLMALLKKVLAAVVKR